MAQQQIITSGADLGVKLESQYTTMIDGFDQVGNILVSDWTKLEDVAQNAADTTNAAADWA